MLKPDERPDRHSGWEVVEIGVEDAADGWVLGQALAEGGEVEHQPPPPGAAAEQPRPPHGDPVLLGVAAGHDVPVIGGGCAGQHLLLGDDPADGRPHARPRGPAPARAYGGRPRQCVQGGHLAEHLATVAGRPAARQQLGGPPDAVGQRAGLRVHQPGGHRLPRLALRGVRRTASPRRIWSASQRSSSSRPAAHPRRPLIGPSVPATVRRSARPNRRLTSTGGRVGRESPSPPLRREVPSPSLGRVPLSVARAGGEPRRHRPWTRRGGHVALGPQEQESDDVLAGELAAGARAPPGRTGAVHDHVVGLGRGAPVEAPGPDLVRADAGPVDRAGEAAGRLGHGRVWRQGEHVRRGPPGWQGDGGRAIGHERG